MKKSIFDFNQQLAQTVLTKTVQNQIKGGAANDDNDEDGID